MGEGRSNVVNPRKVRGKLVQACNAVNEKIRPGKRQRQVEMSIPSQRVRLPLANTYANHVGLGDASSALGATITLFSHGAHTLVYLRLSTFQGLRQVSVGPGLFTAIESDVSFGTAGAAPA